MAANFKIVKCDIYPKLWITAILNIKNVISCMSNFDKILHDGVDLASRP